jgi:hypothetical protein
MGDKVDFWKTANEDSFLGTGEAEEREVKV